MNYHTPSARLATAPDCLSHVFGTLWSGMARSWCLLVHAGAGEHSRAPEREQAYLRALRAACLAGRAALLCEGGSSLRACVAAVASMEDDPCCNAGFGSNLTEDGLVECDASVMDGAHGAFGACGATPGVRNPVRLAERLLVKQGSGRRPLGRVHPMLLAGAGAQRWAQSEGLGSVDPTAMVSPQSTAQWRRYIGLLRDEEARERDQKAAAAASSSSSSSAAAAAVAATATVATASEARGEHSRDAQQAAAAASVCDGPPLKRPRHHGASPLRQSGGAHSGVESSTASGSTAGTGGSTGGSAGGSRGDNMCLGAGSSRGDDASADGAEDALHDTVGAVCCDGTHVSAAVSSGGIWLKHSGRIGEAAAFGAGCWASDAPEASDAAPPAAGRASAGTSVSGVGEHVMQALLARAACEALCEASPCFEELGRLLSEPTVQLSADGGSPAAIAAGIIALRCDPTSEGHSSSPIEIVVVHSSPSFAVGYLHHERTTPKVFISRQPPLSSSPRLYCASVPAPIS